MKKRLLSAALCLCMLLTLLPTVAFADGGNEQMGYSTAILHDESGTYQDDELYDAGSYQLAVSMETGGYSVSATNLKQHQNGQGTTGYWAGVAVTAPANATQMKVAMSTTAAPSLEDVTATALEKRVFVNEEGTAYDGVAFYADTAKVTTLYCAVQWLDADGKVVTSTNETGINEVYSFTVDFSGVTHYEETGVAQIGDVGYSTLAAAIAAAKDGDTITIRKEYDATSEGTITLNADKAVTLDLGGNKLTLSRFNLVQGRLTVQNGSVDCDGQAFNVYAAPRADTAADYTKLVIAKGATVDAAYAVCLFPEPNSTAGYNSTIEIYGKLATGGIFISGNLGNDTTTAGDMVSSNKIPTVTIYDDAVVNNGIEGQGIAMNGLANVTVEGGTISGSEAIGVKRGTLTVNGGTFTSEGEHVDPAVANNNGTEATGATISITSTYNYAGPISVTLKDGTFTSKNSPAVYLGHSKSGDTTKTYTQGVTLDIQGGTFTSLKEGMTPIYVANKESGDAESYTKEVISGGTFSQDLSVSDYLASSVQYQVTHQAGGFSYTETLTDAQALAQSGDTITDLNAATENTVTLTLNYNDGGATTNGTYTVAINTEIPLPTPPARTNYRFDGWKAADGTIYNAGNSYKVETDGVTLTAQWTYTGGSSGGGSTTTYYSSTVEKTENGTVTVSPKNASKNTTVTITVTPDDGYELDTLTVTDKDGKAVELTKVSDTKYTFKMPASKVTVKAAFAEEEIVSTLPFTDVATGDWFYEAVKYAYDNSMMNGVGHNLFAPSSNLTRGMIAQVLYNLEGTPAAGNGVFTDVAADQWYADAVNWAAANDIVGGYGNGKFGPEDDITREQMAQILYNYAAFKGYDVSTQGDLSTFNDGAKTSDWALSAMKWAVGSGLLQGYNGNLNPTGTATRAEVAQILMNFCENIAK